MASPRPPASNAAMRKPKAPEANRARIVQALMRGCPRVAILATSRERLAIPGASSTATTSYRVRSGDTLGLIASRHGTSVSAIVALNGLSNPNLIRVGQVLKVAAGGSSAPAVRAAAGGATKGCSDGSGSFSFS